MARSGLWRNGDFLKLWSAQTISQVGSQITMLALPLAAIYAMHASTFEVAALGILEYLPFVLLSLPAGVWIDRISRRPILIGADCGRALALASIPIASAAGVLTLVQIYVVAFVVGSLTVLFDVAYQSYLPSLVESDGLADGNGKLELSRSAAQIGGPGMAGFLVGLLTAAYAIAADAASFLGSAFLLFAIRGRKESHDAQRRTRSSFRVEVRSGMRYVVRHPLMRPLLIQIALLNFFVSLVNAILLVYAIRVLHMSAAFVGIAFSIGNLGFLAGVIAGRRLAARHGVGRVLIGGAGIAGMSYLLLPLASTSLATSYLAAAQFIYGFGVSLYYVHGISLIQAITPEHMLGRATASRRFIVWGVIPFGQLCGGALGAVVGLRPAVWIGAAGAAVSSVPLLWSPVRSVRSVEDAAALGRAVDAEHMPALVEAIAE
jgi:MFS family permease